MSRFFVPLARPLGCLCLSITLVLQIAAQTAAGLSESERKLAKSISVSAIKNYTVALSSDAMEGRGTGQPGGERAAKWIADQFKSLGLKPLGDNGTYLQAAPFTETLLLENSVFSVDGSPLVLGKDWTPVPIRLSDDELSGELVFAGHGVEPDSLKPKEFKDADLADKFVVVIDGRPKSLSKEDWANARGSTLRMISVMRKGPKGLILVPNGLETHPPELTIDYLSRRFITPPIAAQRQGSSPPIIYVTASVAARLFAKAGMPFKDALELAEKRDFSPVPLNISAKVAIKHRQTGISAYNVAGYIEGSDPKLKSEAVLFTAHYDGYGMIKGKIYNGAADNALGNAEMLAAARAFSKMKVKPKRSLVFLSVTAEEAGLLGSRHWVEHPTWDLKKVAGVMNLDGIGTEIFGPVKNIVGFGAEHSTLGPVLEDVAKGLGITMMPDPMPEEDVFRRSDHYSFVQRGVPALMLLGAPGGTKESLVSAIKSFEGTKYHQPSDDISPTWNWGGAKSVADIMAIVGLRIAQQQEMPSWLPASPYAKLNRGDKASPGT